jgi:hypothetical protein
VGGWWVNPSIQQRPVNRVTLLGVVQQAERERMPAAITWIIAVLCPDQ